jgi:hypothetical protein
LLLLAHRVSRSVAAERNGQKGLALRDTAPQTRPENRAELAPKASGAQSFWRLKLGAAEGAQRNLKAEGRHRQAWHAGLCSGQDCNGQDIPFATYPFAALAGRSAGDASGVVA